MRLTNKIVDAGNIVGYLLDMDMPALIPLHKDTLYTEMYMMPLLEEGYKYFSREANDIVDPSGTPINTLPEIPLSTVDQDLWNSGVELALQSAWSDTEASKYYSYKEASVVQFRTEATYEINTREEFIAYLESIRSALYSVGYSVDNRPLNYFVNPEAYFTIDELRNNSQYKGYLDVIIKRHVFRNYSAYAKLVKWLCDKGVLNTMSPSKAEFLAAYYAWGPEGIKDKCTGFETKIAVDGAFNFHNDPLSSGDKDAYIAANRDTRYAVYNDREEVFSLKLKESYKDIQSFRDLDRARIAIAEDGTLFKMRRSEPTGYKYRVMPELALSSYSTSVSDVTDRLYFTLISESGYTYQYKVADNKLRLGLAHAATLVYYSPTNFAYQTIASAIRVPLSYVDNQQDFYLWNLTILKILNMIKGKIVSAPVSSTSDFLVKDGISPNAVIDYISSIIDADYYKYNEEGTARYMLRDDSEGLSRALSRFLNPVPEDVLRAFKLTSDDLEYGIESFLELADPDDLADRRERMALGEIEMDSPDYDKTYTFPDRLKMLKSQKAPIPTDAMDVYQSIKFAYDCLSGGISIGAFADGIMEDREALDILDKATIVLSVAYAEFGTNYSSAYDFVRHIENTNLIDVREWSKVRDAGLHGFMVDFARYRDLRCNIDKTVFWMYCSKVFREISNKPISEQRPYLMEVVALGRNKADMTIRQLMKAVVDQAIDESGISDVPYATSGPMAEWSDKKCVKASASYVAATLFFYVIAGRVKQEPVNDVFELKLPIMGCEDLILKLPKKVYDFILSSFNVNAHKRYVTVCDYCRKEYEPMKNGGWYNWCLVNADVTPWMVTAKKGFSIRTYSLMPNYYSEQDLIGSRGPEYVEDALNKNALLGYKDQSGNFVSTPIKEFTMSDYLLSYEDDMLWQQTLMQIRDAESEDDLRGFLTDNESEPVAAYVRRWTLARRQAKAMGKTLLSIPLKQDLLYGDLAKIIYNQEVSTDIEYCDASQGLNFLNLNDMVPIRWTEGTVAMSIETTKYHIERFDLSDLDLDNLGVDEIISGDYNSGVMLAVSGNFIIARAQDDIKIFVPGLDKAGLDNLAADNFIKCIGNDMYYVKAVNGDFIIKR